MNGRIVDPRRWWVDTEEVRDRLHDACGVLVQVGGTDDQQLFARKHRVPTIELFPVAASCDVTVAIEVPDGAGSGSNVRPALRQPALLGIERGGEVEALHVDPNHVPIVGERPFHRITKQDQKPRIGRIGVVALGYGRVEQVLGCGVDRGRSPQGQVRAAAALPAHTAQQ